MLQNLSQEHISCNSLFCDYGVSRALSRQRARPKAAAAASKMKAAAAACKVNLLAVKGMAAGKRNHTNRGAPTHPPYLRGKLHSIVMHLQT